MTWADGLMMTGGREPFLAFLKKSPSLNPDSFKLLSPQQKYRDQKCNVMAFQLPFESFWRWLAFREQCQQQQMWPCPEKKKPYI